MISAIVEDQVPCDPNNPAPTNLYAALGLTNPLAQEVMDHLHPKPPSPPRFRDAYYAVKDGKPYIVILTRTGGDGRANYAAANEAMCKHPLYDHDHDDELDTSFALWWFRAPNETVGNMIKGFVASKGAYPSRHAKMQAAIDHMQRTGEIPDLSGIPVMSTDPAIKNVADLYRKSNYRHTTVHQYPRREST